MDEATWLSSTNPQEMLEYIRPQASERKLRLFALNCLDLRAIQYVDMGFKRVPPSRWDAVESRMDTQRPTTPLQWAQSWAEGPENDWPSAADKTLLFRLIFGNPFADPSWLIFRCPSCHQEDSLRFGREKRLPDCPDCNVKMPHRLTFWLTQDVLSTAQTCYDNRDATAFIPLWDQLETADCTSEEIRRALVWEQRCPKCLGKGFSMVLHSLPDWYRSEMCESCHGTGWLPIPGEPFMVRGMWVVDTLLGKG